MVNWLSTPVRLSADVVQSKSSYMSGANLDRDRPTPSLVVSSFIDFATGGRGSTSACYRLAGAASSLQGLSSAINAQCPVMHSDELARSAGGAADAVSLLTPYVSTCDPTATLGFIYNKWAPLLEYTDVA